MAKQPKNYYDKIPEVIYYLLENYNNHDKTDINLKKLDEYYTSEKHISEEEILDLAGGLTIQGINHYSTKMYKNNPRKFSNDIISFLNNISSKFGKKIDLNIIHKNSTVTKNTSVKGISMTYEEAKIKVLHEINIQESKLKKLRDCLQYLENEEKSNDDLTQSPAQILNNFGSVS